MEDPSGAPDAPTHAAIARLSSTPWCAALLSDPAWEPAQTWSRVAKPHRDGGADSFFAETLATNRTIVNCLTLRPKDLNDGWIEGKEGEPAYREVRTIMELGDGLNGHPKICHGGFVATMLDEVTGVLIQFNLERKVRRLKREGKRSAGLSCFTACKCNFSSPRMSLRSGFLERSQHHPD